MLLLLVNSDNYKIFLRKHLAFLNVILLAFTCFITSCSSPVDLPDFDEKAWQKDVRSCQNIRPTLVPALLKNKSQLVGLNHNQILSTLGKPEGNSLEKSGERVYFYYLQSGDQCKNKTMQSAASKLFIRFDALDRVYKVRVDNEG
ncbi:hypothetical protein AAE02nite_13530 [Adhaeribacter aerolatus]|uniref:Lipoprotein SmpA/OmlA domain-containing protein n=1 Tax=Adhaeribacter aerolatus TaxID=670289 RepID=A0A512AVF4_9BACT|nr:hypothetical protein [Adhaeribacter aerolatus]GEO03689.1 hypothetical protein AAE02nite_13530 [Adhaeribacter aerolatus]